MAENMKENMTTIKNMVVENILALMAKFMMANGLMESDMGRERW